ISGYIYFWEVVGPDPLPKRASTIIRLGILFASMPIHLFMGVYLMQLTEIMGLAYYQSLEIPWPHDFLDDQKVGGGIAWGFGQFPLAIVFGKLALDWLREDRSESRFYDAKAEVDGDVDMEEYNRMIAELSRVGNQGQYRKQKSASSIAIPMQPLVQLGLAAALLRGRWRVRLCITNADR